MAWYLPMLREDSGGSDEWPVNMMSLLLTNSWLQVKECQGAGTVVLGATEWRVSRERVACWCLVCVWVGVSVCVLSLLGAALWTRWMTNKKMVGGMWGECSTTAIAAGLASPQLFCVKRVGTPQPICPTPFAGGGCCTCIVAAAQSGSWPCVNPGTVVLQLTCYWY